jgi:hypothetical protein
MGWINRFWVSAEAESAAPWDVVNGAHDARKAIRSSHKNPALSDGRPDALADDIKRRQISLAVRYVATVRAR